MKQFIKAHTVQIHPLLYFTIIMLILLRSVKKSEKIRCVQPITVIFSPVVKIEIDVNFKGPIVYLALNNWNDLTSGADPAYYMQVHGICSFCSNPIGNKIFINI